jgi:hypothetical protein
MMVRAPLARARVALAGDFINIGVFTGARVPTLRARNAKGAAQIAPAERDGKGGD